MVPSPFSPSGILGSFLHRPSCRQSSQGLETRVKPCFENADALGAQPCFVKASPTPSPSLSILDALCAMIPHLVLWTEWARWSASRVTRPHQASRQLASLLGRQAKRPCDDSHGRLLLPLALELLQWNSLSVPGPHVLPVRPASARLAFDCVVNLTRGPGWSAVPESLGSANRPCALSAPDLRRLNHLTDLSVPDGSLRFLTARAAGQRQAPGLTVAVEGVWPCQVGDASTS